MHTPTGGNSGQTQPVARKICGVRNRVLSTTMNDSLIFHYLRDNHQYGKRVIFYCWMLTSAPADFWKYGSGQKGAFVPGVSRDLARVAICETTQRIDSLGNVSYFVSPPYGRYDRTRWANRFQPPPQKLAWYCILFRLPRYVANWTVVKSGLFSIVKSGGQW